MAVESDRSRVGVRGLFCVQSPSSHVPASQLYRSGEMMESRFNERYGVDGGARSNETKGTIRTLRLDMR